MIAGDYKVMLVRCSEQRRVYIYGYTEDGYKAAMADLPGQGFEVERYPVQQKHGDVWTPVEMGRVYQRGEALPACGARARVLAGGRRPAASTLPFASSVPMLAPGSISSCRLSFEGFDDDKVGPTPLPIPDGKLDGHWKITLRFPPDAELLAIAMYSAVGDGRPHGGLVWHSRGAPHWVLGVFDQGRCLNTQPGPPLGRFSGEKTFDLYAADAGWFVEGNWLLVMAWLGDGRALVDCAEVGRWGR